MTSTPGGQANTRAAEPATGRPRRDAEANRERVLAAAAAAMTREGHHVPLATIAAEAGVGVGTLYRKYADRGGRRKLDVAGDSPARGLADLPVELDERAGRSIRAAEQDLAGQMVGRYKTALGNPSDADVESI